MFEMWVSYMEGYLSMVLIAANVSGLVFNSISDLRTREISLTAAGITGACGLLCRVALLSDFSADAVLGLMPGLICLLLAKITRESIGYGDGWVLLGTGIGMGGQYMLSMCMLALFAAGLFALVLIVCFHKGRKYQLPLVPFLLLGYLCTLFVSWTCG